MSMIAIHPDDVLIKAYDTPNPMAVKFVVNFSLKNIGNATFTSKEETNGLTMVSSLFDIPGVVQIYIFQNTLTITHTEELPMDMVKDQTKAIIKSRITVHNPDFESPEDLKAKQKPDRSNLTGDRLVIEEVLDRTIRPGLQNDGGGVEVIDFQNNVLKISYQGACGGCPSSMMGTLDAIQNILRHELNNDTITVEPV